MAYRTVATTVLSGQDCLDTAIACARAWSAHLDVACLSRSQLEVPALVAPDSGAARPLLLDEASEDVARLERWLGPRLAAEDVAFSIDARPGLIGTEARDLVAARRFADLAVFPAAAGGGAGAQDWVMQALVEATLRQGRVPLLLVPSAVTPPFARVMVAWDGSDVALAATRAALPLLGAAEAVEIVTVDPPDAMAGEDLAVLLDRHGIAATVTPLARGGQQVPEVLSRHARESGADLLVMGAYGHRRLRDVILGGVTRKMLERCALPLFLAR